MKFTATNTEFYFPRALADELIFHITLALTNMVVKGSDPAKLGYELTNIQLEYMRPFMYMM